MHALIALVALAVGQPAAGQSGPTRGDRVLSLVARGDARRAAGDAISALGYYRDAITVGPRRSEGYVALGALYRALDEPTRALEVYDAAARAEVVSEQLAIAHAEALLAHGKADPALTMLRRLLRLEPDSRAALAALAEAAEARGAFIEALAARRALVRLCLRDGDGAEALRDAHTRVRALERILGAAERVRDASRCATTDPLARALARCR